MYKYAVSASIAIILLLSAVLLSVFPTPAVGLSDLMETVSAPPTEDTGDNLAANAKLRLSFSETGYFYDRDIEVAITASVADAKIYYTTNGSEPTSTSSEYTGPLTFTASDSVKAVVLKAYAEYGDTFARPMVHTYFLGKGIDSRFDTLVFSLSTDPEHLYDYDTGIFVEGRLRDEYLAENPGVWPDPPAPANFNIRGMEGERPVYVETFTPEGERVVAQAAGVRVSGGWSRANAQKSLRLIARNEYEPGFGKFHYDFFPGETVNDPYGTPLSKFDSIILRNGANDRDSAMLRNEAMSVIAREAGFRDVTPVRAAAVFLNGEYYGFSWLQVSLNEQYLQDVYSAPQNSFDIVGNGEEWLVTDSLSAQSAIQELNNYANKDLTNDAVFAELETIVDIDNLLWYYAFEIYVGNDDWPDNNMKRWRYTGPQIEGLAPELDGRWRYLLFDLDWALGLYGDRYNKPTLDNVLGGHKNSPMLTALLRRTDMAEQFAMILCDIAVNIITPESVNESIDTLYEEASHEIRKALASSKYAFWVNEQVVEEQHAVMLDYAMKRRDYILERAARYLRYNMDFYDVEVTGGLAVIGTAWGTTSRYYDRLTVPVRPVLPQFTVFDHWVLNGKTIYEPEITVSAADATNGVVRLELVTHDEPPALSFAEAFMSPNSNGCTLVNTTQETIYTEGLYLSDTWSQPHRFALPAASIKPGGTLELAGKGSSDKSDLLKISMNFNVKVGEVLYLSDENGTIIDFVTVNALTP